MRICLLNMDEHVDFPVPGEISDDVFLVMCSLWVETLVCLTPELGSNEVGLSHKKRARLKFEDAKKGKTAKCDVVKRGQRWTLGHGIEKEVGFATPLAITSDCHCRLCILDWGLVTNLDPSFRVGHLRARNFWLMVEPCSFHNVLKHRDKNCYDWWVQIQIVYFFV